MATEIVAGADGRAVGVVYRDGDGLTRYVACSFVVLACSAVESARLLLLSRSSAFPSGLANGSGSVGRHLIFSSATLGGAAFEPGTFGAEVARHLSAQRSIQDFYHLDPPIDGVAKAGTLNFLVGYVEPIAAAEAVAFRAPSPEAKNPHGVLWGSRLKKQIGERLRQQHIHYESFCEFYANAGTYVDLDPKAKDRWGSPVARMTVAPHAKTREATALLGRMATRILDAMHPAERYVTAEHVDTKFLQGGTCRFGVDPATSVLDKNCRAHEVPNLYVTDGSFMPTSGGVPFTMTIMANALRVADHLVDRLRGGGS
jgi:choline dehydrogenase-like flavoprotein